MKKLTPVVLVFLSLCISVVEHAAVWAVANDVLITAVQTETTASASEEYVTITNNSSAAIDISTWHVQYFSASAANFDSPTRNIALSGTLASHQNFMIASSGYKTSEAQAFFGATLAATGGHIRLVRGSGSSLVQHDLLGWGTALHPEGSAIAAAAKGQIYSRKKVDNLFVDTDSNAQDFTNGANTDPQSANQGVSQSGGQNGQDNPPASDGQSGSSDGGVEADADGVTSLLRITELLPDPAAPATDAQDEYIELCNGGSQAVDLTGYKLQSGANNTYSYTFKSGTLAAGSYMVLYVRDTKLTLSNSTGKARLLDPAGTVVDETATYKDVPTGSAWALIDTVWQWTASLTPGAANTLTAAPVKSTAGTTKGATSTSKTSSSSSKTKAASTSKSSSAKDKNATTSSAGTAYEDPKSDGKSLPVQPLLLAAVGVPLIGYMLYEYRHDLANYFSKRRRNRRARQEARPAFARERGH